MRATFYRAMVLALLAGMAAAQTDCELGAKELRNVPPQGVTPEQIVQRAAANESAFKAARLGYAYTQDIRVQTLRRGVLPADLFPDGEFHQESQVSYAPDGRRIEEVTYAPQSTLRRVAMTREDFDDLLERTEFVLLPETLHEYEVHYLGQQHVDELDTYVFEAAPVTIDKKKRYYQGRIWIEQHDLAIVKSCGKTVPDEILPKKKKRGSENIHPTFVAYREMVDGKFWMPAYARSDDLLEFRTGPVRIREVVKFMDYHKPGAKPKPSAASALQK